ncbi:MAG: hypothetical protein DMF61_26255 [Blastocatellia bacterium AA13]|nr:MAG: hypothetical protein DMF61_26255 [Blastocatellia bacterium AA13]
MPRALCSIILIVLSVTPVASLMPVSADAAPAAQNESIAHIKAAVTKFGVGKEARVRVKLRDKKTLSGYVSSIDDSSFVITDPGTGRSETVEYKDVDQIRGKNLSTGAKIAIGVGIAIAALALLVIIGLSHGD